MAAVGIHLHQHGVAALEAPVERRQVGRAQTVLGGAVHDVDAVAVRRGRLVGEPTGAVGAPVVDDEDVDVGAGFAHPAEDERKVLQLVVGRDDHQVRRLGSGAVSGCPADAALAGVFFGQPSSRALLRGAFPGLPPGCSCASFTGGVLADTGIVLGAAPAARRPHESTILQYRRANRGECERDQ